MNGTVLNFRNEKLHDPLQSRAVDDTIYAKLATTERNHADAQELRHDAYSAAGYLSALRSRRYVDKYDSEQNSKTFVLYRRDVAIASARICALDPQHREGISDAIPAGEMFQSEIDSFMSARMHSHPQSRAVEVTRLSRNPVFSRDMTLMQALFRMIGYLVLYYDADVMFAAITTNHVPLYRRMGFQLIADQRDYPGLNVQTALVVCHCHSHSGIKGVSGSLRDISKHDEVYKNFTSGEIVNVPSEPKPQSPTLPNALGHTVLSHHATRQSA